MIGELNSSFTSFKKLKTIDFNLSFSSLTALSRLFVVFSRIEADN